MSVRAPILFLALLLPLACFSGPSTRSTINAPAAEAATCKAPTVSEVALRAKIRERVAVHRRQQALVMLEVHESVDVVAQRHADLMAGRARMSHDGKEKRFERLSALYGWEKRAGRFAENVAEVCGDEEVAAQQAIEGWLGSASHRRNIEGEFKAMGIGVTQGTSGWIYVSQLFYAPPET